MDRKNLHVMNKEKLQRLDQRALRVADELLDADIPRGKALEILQSIKAQHAEKGFLTEGQRVLIRKLDRDYEDYDYLHTMCASLAKLLEDGKIPDTAENFVRSVVTQFNDKHFITPLQLEQMIRIVEENDPVTPEVKGENKDEDGPE